MVMIADEIDTDLGDVDDQVDDEGRRMTEAKPQRMTMVLIADEIEEASSPGGRRHTDEHGDDC